MMHSGTSVKCMKIAKDECSINNLNAEQEQGASHLLFLKQNALNMIMLPPLKRKYSNDMTVIFSEVDVVS